MPLGFLVFALFDFMPPMRVLQYMQHASWSGVHFTYLPVDFSLHCKSNHAATLKAKHNRQVLWGSTGGLPCPGSDWQGLMSFPRVVELDPHDSSRLVSFPLPEISTLWTNGSTISQSFEVAADATHRLPASFGGNQLDVTLSFDANASAPRTFGVRVLAPRGTSVMRGVNVTVSTTPDSVFATLGGGAVHGALPTLSASHP
jgi:hypothetical protein